MKNRRTAIAVVAALCALAAAPARADSVSVVTEGGYGPIVFPLDPAAKAAAAITSGVATVTFSRKVNIDPVQITRGFDAYVSTARLDPKGLTLRLAWAQEAKLHTSASANRFALDLVPINFSGMPADLPP